MIINLKDRLTTSNRNLIQYDYGQVLKIFNVGVNINNLQFQFIQDDIEIDQLGIYDSVNDCYTVNFPDKFLQNDSEVNCFVYLDNGKEGKTIKIINFQIFDREMFNSVPDEKTKDLIGEIFDKLNELQNQIDDFEITEEQLERLVEQVIESIGDNIYTKEETNQAINAALAPYATCEQVSQTMTSFGQSIQKQINEVNDSINELKEEVETANAELEVI